MRTGYIALNIQADFVAIRYKIKTIKPIIALWVKHLNNLFHLVSVITMRGSSATIDLEGNNNTAKALDPARIDGFSPSMKLVLNILEKHGSLTQKEITKETHLPSRTVRYALNRLKDEGVLDELEYFPDARQCLYQIKC